MTVLPDSPMVFADRAACRDVDAELFFHHDGEKGPARAQRVADAKAVCFGCVVRAECLTWALARREEYGVWGGLSEDERRGLNDQPPRRPVQPIEHGTAAGYRTHRRRGEDACPSCTNAATRYRSGLTAAASTPTT